MGSLQQVRQTPQPTGRESRRGRDVELFRPILRELKELKGGHHVCTCMYDLAHSKNLDQPCKVSIPTHGQLKQRKHIFYVPVALEDMVLRNRIWRRVLSRIGLLFCKVTSHPVWCLKLSTIISLHIVQEALDILLALVNFVSKMPSRTVQKRYSSGAVPRSYEGHAIVGSNLRGNEVCLPSDTVK